MIKRAQLFIAFLVLGIVILACAVPIPSSSPALPTPTSGTPTLLFSPGDVGTAVAMTLTAAVPTAVSTNTPEAVSTASPAPVGGPVSLPHTLYYLAPDSIGKVQVFRMEKDGSAPKQVTSESTDVSDYDVSLVDGSVAYVANNQLLYINADGSERRMLVDGGPIDTNNPFLSTVSKPVFSLDAKTLAYGYKGLQIYSFSADESELVIENEVDDAGGTSVPRELYSPERYSPDGSKLLITLSYQEGASSAVYYPATNALVRLEGGEGALICCDNVEWSADSASFYSASASTGMYVPGLWKVDAATGEVTTLIQGDAGNGSYNTAKEPYLAPDGQLYFFFATVSSPEGTFNRAPLQLIRSAPDGVTGRTVLRSDTFDLLNEALWAPDASFVIVANAPGQDVNRGGQAEIVYTDGRPNVVLLPSAMQMKWGP